ncbi:MAG: biotin/lipoyl-containing protein [Christensenellales bacterium]|jgi:biotin carboxyl carrier protein
MRKFRITVDGRAYEVEVEELGGAISAPVQALPQAQIQSIPAPQSEPAKAPAKPQAANKPAGGSELKSPMPGTILDLKVDNGATVKRGDVILVLEAMKMENDISAHADGVISFTVNKGSMVNTGDVLAVIA